jgi:hydrogenase/urease accessory protein HupE
MRVLAALVCALAVILSAGTAGAHALQPGFLELRALGDNTWGVFWKKPAVAGQPMPIDALLPETCDPRTPPAPRFDGTAYVARWLATCAGGLEGGVIAIAGLERTRTDVLVRYELVPGEGEARRLTPLDAAFTVPEAPGLIDVARTYFRLGVDHILQGADHLLFVFALVLLIRDRWRLLGAITAFTVAHSLTLAAAALGWVVVPAPPVEAVVALSIMFLASELLQSRATGTRLSERYPWIVAFAFGLLHGLGFARALLEVGLPERDLPLALLTFNLGVEAGQIMFIGFVLLVGAQLRRLYPATVGAVGTPGGAGVAGVGYAIGGLAAFWFVSRIAAF